MSKRKAPDEQAKTFPREALLKSQRFSRYQKDFLAAVLCEPEYTIADAEKAVINFFGKD